MPVRSNTRTVYITSSGGEYTNRREAIYAEQLKHMQDLVYPLLRDEGKPMFYIMTEAGPGASIDQVLSNIIDNRKRVIEILSDETVLE